MEQKSIKKWIGVLGCAFAGAVSLQGCELANGAATNLDVKEISQDRAACQVGYRHGLLTADVLNPDGKLIVRFGLGSNIFAAENEGVALYPKGRGAGSRFRTEGDFVIDAKNNRCLVSVNGRTFSYSIL